MDDRLLSRLFERALAFAYAALDMPTRERAKSARAAADAALRTLERDRVRMTLTDARHVVHLVARLREVLAALDRQPVPA